MNPGIHLLGEGCVLCSLQLIRSSWPTEQSKYDQGSKETENGPLLLKHGMICKATQAMGDRDQ